MPDEPRRIIAIPGPGPVSTIFSPTGRNSADSSPPGCRSARAIGVRSSGFIARSRTRSSSAGSSGGMSPKVKVAARSASAARRAALSRSTASRRSISSSGGVQPPSGPPSDQAGVSTHRSSHSASEADCGTNEASHFFSLAFLGGLVHRTTAPLVAIEADALAVEIDDRQQRFGPFAAAFGRKLGAKLGIILGPVGEAADAVERPEIAVADLEDQLAQRGRKPEAELLLDLGDVLVVDPLDRLDRRRIAGRVGKDGRIEQGLQQRRAAVRLAAAILRRARIIAFARPAPLVADTRRDARDKRL